MEYRQNRSEGHITQKGPRFLKGLELMHILSYKTTDTLTAQQCNVFSTLACTFEVKSHQVVVYKAKQIPNIHMLNPICCL